MSDPGAGPDPMDKAYVEAEAVLDDADARAARRARVLGAVAQEPTTVSAPPIRLSAWRRGRWLAAACVAGLGVLVAIQTYHPAVHEQQVASTVATPTAAGQRLAAPSAAPAAAASEAPSSEAAVAPPQATPAPPPALAKAEPPLRPPRFVTVPPLRPPVLKVAPSPLALPAAAPPPPPPPSGVVVTAERRESAPAIDDQSAARGTEERAQVPVSAFAGPASADQATRDETLAGMPPDRAADLRAAAAAGRTADVQALLAQGVPVDAADAEGDTALMKSVRADRPAAAALLRRHGASLDRKNDAGESVRDMAKAIGDAALDQALGLGP